MRFLAWTCLWGALALGGPVPGAPGGIKGPEVAQPWEGGAPGRTEVLSRSPGPPAAAPDTLELRAVARTLATETGSPAVGVIVVEGGAVQVGSWGLRVAGREDPVRPGDAWHVGSNTKAMTGVLAARLVEAGLLRWDTTVEEVLGSLVEVGGAFGTVTLAELLAHRSGLQANLPPPRAMGLAGADSLRDLRGDRLAYAGVVLGMDPGGERGDFLYSNAGYVVAGAMMEAVADTTWEALLRREVWDPLGIEGGGFGAPGGIHGHRGTPEDGLAPVPPSPFADNIPAMGPGARVHLPLEGYGRFLAAVLAGARGEGDPGFLRPESWAILHSPGGSGATGEEGGPPYALGWGLLPPAGEGALPPLQHAGSNTLWLALARVDPARDRAVALLLNDGRMELISPAVVRTLETLLGG